MANQNLSQFGEKLFVADADHTFIWDSAALISKRVSRNSWLNSGTLTSDAPVTISQTWNDLPTVFTALKVNATSTNSALASKLLDLQLGGVSQFNVDKGGTATSVSSGNYPSYAVKFGSQLSGIGAGSSSGTLLFWAGNAAPGFGNANLCLKGDTVHLRHAGRIVFGQADFGWGAEDTILLRDGAPNTLALRNGANTQTFNVYGSYGSISDYKRLSISCDQTTGNATITNQAAGYTAGTVSINGVPVGLGKGNVSTNVAVGFQALNVNTSGDNNTGVGVYALLSNTTGFWNTGFGSGALYSNTTGANNTAVGIGSIQMNTTGSGNTALGKFAGSAAVSGNNVLCNNSVFIGADTKVNATSETNQIVIGHTAVGIGSHSVVLGNDSIEKTALKGNVGIGTTSPTSKLQVTNGDVEIETVTSGIIMKAAGTSTRYRITLNAGGTALVFTAI